MFPVFVLPLGGAATLVVTAAFLIVFVTVYEVLKKVHLFQSPADFVVAGCVALLSVLGLLQLTPPPPLTSPGGEPETAHTVCIEFIPLPYATLALAVVFMLLLAWIGGRFQGNRRTKSAEAGRHKQR